ncbi:MAG: rhomboid family intramembrane serine protease [Janthinobacterium lividum]
MPDTWDFSRPQQRQADPMAQMPILTYLLAGLSVLITAAALVSGGQPGSLLYNIGSFGYADPEKIWNGHIWGLVTTVFIHGSWFHLLFNMIWLVQLGRLLERSLPPAIYLVFLVASAAVGSTCEMLISGQTGIGMSGVVYAMFGLMWAGRGLYPAWGSLATRDNLRLFIGWGLFCVVATYFHFLNVANGAHGGGFLFGLCIGYLFYSPRRITVWAIPLTLLIAASILACTWQPWSGDWTFWKGNREFERKHYAQAIGWYRSSLRRGGDPHDNWNNIGAAWNNIALEDISRKDISDAANAQTEADNAASKAGPGN